VKNCSVYVSDDSAFEPEEQFHVHLGSPLGNHWSGARIGKIDMATVTITNDEDGKRLGSARMWALWYRVQLQGHQHSLIKLIL